MDLFKLPILIQKNISKENNNNLTICNYQTKRNINIIKTPLKLRNIISFNKSENKVDNYSLNSHRIKEIENKNNEYDLIKQFLYQKLDYKYLKPIKVLQKSKSSFDVNKEKYSNYFYNNYIEKENMEKINNNKYSFLLFNKFNKILSNSNLHKKKIINVNKYLFKKNENDTNGNFIYNDYNEEKKETITFIINSNNSKELFKKKLTKKSIDNNNQNNNNLILDNFKFCGKKYNSPTKKNIKKIKYLQEMIHQKNKNNLNINKNLSNKNIILKDINNDKYNCFIKENIKNIDNKIDYTARNLMNLDKLIKSCLDDSKNQFNLDSKNIFGEKYLK